MEKHLYVFLFSLTALVSPVLAQNTYIAVQDGKWESASTWNLSGTPGAGDNVIIKGFTVTINDATGDVSIANLMLDNSGAGDTTLLTVGGNRTLDVSGNLEGYLDNTNEHVRLNLFDDAIVNVTGNFIFERKNTNYNTKRLRLYIANNAALNVTGNFNYTYGAGNILEILQEVYLKNKGSLTVGQDMNLGMAGGNALTLEAFDSSRVQVLGDVNLVQTGGGWLSFKASEQSRIVVGGKLNAVTNGGVNIDIKAKDNGKLRVDGDLNMDSQSANSLITLNATTSGVIDVNGDITMVAQSAGDLYIGLYNNSELQLEGSFLRTLYGRLDMGSNATLLLNGSQVQTVPAEDIDGNGSDDFEISNIEFDNTAGFALEDTMVITGNLSLTEGIITTYATKPLIIADGATSDPGNENAYVDGPMIKQGSTAGSSFTFPLGDDGIYAPLEITEIVSSDDQFIAEYAKDPPPIEDGNGASLNHMSTLEYWSLNRLAGSTPVHVTLHWQDTSASGIEDPSTLVVAYARNPGSAWESVGNGGTSINGAGGSLASADPPPIEDSKFTFGSEVAGGNALPVELMRFDAIEEGEEVLIEWETAQETNASHFMVEKSRDGQNFEPVYREDASGVSTRSHQYYEALDEHPYVGVSYYRLKMVDLDGTYSYSDLKAVEIKVIAEVMLFPNPVFDILYVKYGEEANEKVLIEVYNQQGQLLYRGYEVMMDSEVMISAEKMNVSAPGTYILNIHGNTGSQSLRFIKGL